MIDLSVLTLLTGCMSDACGSPSGRFVYLDRQPVAATDAVFWQSETSGVRLGKNGKKRQAESVGK